MINSDGFFDWAIQWPGAANKVYAAPNAMEGIACHSAEGWLPFLLSDVQDPSSGHSWTGSIALDGTFYQHYSVRSSIWASGNRTANTRLIAFESEGTFEHPLNRAQRETFKRITVDFEAFTGQRMTREEPRTLWQHNEVWDWGTPNAGWTECPSNRYDQVFKEIDSRKDSPMTPEEKAAFDALQAQVTAINDAVVLRGKVHQVADDPDIETVKAAGKALADAGLIA